MFSSFLLASSPLCALPEGRASHIKNFPQVWLFHLPFIHSYFVRYCLSSHRKISILSFSLKQEQYLTQVAPGKLFSQKSYPALVKFFILNDKFLSSLPFVDFSYYSSLDIINLEAQVTCSNLKQSNLFQLAQIPLGQLMLIHKHISTNDPPIVLCRVADERLMKMIGGCL